MELILIKYFKKVYNISESVTKQSPEGFNNFECNGKCEFNVSYAEGSSYSGSLWKELFSLEEIKNENNGFSEYNQQNGNSETNKQVENLKSNNSLQKNENSNAQKSNQLENIKNLDTSQNVSISEKPTYESFYIIMGCAEQETGLFQSQKADGIIGMSPRKNDPKNANIVNLMKTQGLTQDNIYSICLGLDGGSFNINDWNSEFHITNEKKIILDLKNYDWSNFIQIPIDNIFIGGEQVNYDFSVYKFSSFSHAFLDTGTTMTYFPQNLYLKIQNNFDNFCKKENENCFSSSFENCYSKSFLSKSDSEIIKTFPILKFEIENYLFEWLPENYLIITDNEVCLGFEKEENSYSNTITLGGTFMRNYDFLIDTDKNLLGIVKSNCNPKIKHFSHKIYKDNFYNKKINKKILDFRKKKIIFQNFNPFLFFSIFAIVLLCGIIRILFNKRRGEGIYNGDEFIPLEFFE